MKKVCDKRQKEMYRLIYKWTQSGMTQKSFCKAEGINYYNFKYWRTRQNQENQLENKSYDNSKNQLPDFVPLEECSSNLDYSLWEMRFPNGITLTCPVGTNLDQLKKPH